MLKLCDDIDTMAMTLLDGELADQELRDMELHLLACTSCKTLVERERAAHQLRRQRLAAPPAPMLLRARINRALDEVDRARRPSLRSYVLPTGAALAAVAALLVFVTSSGTAGKADRAIAGSVEGARAEDKIEKIGTGALGERPERALGELRFQRSGHQFLDRNQQVAVVYYAVLTPDGETLSLQAMITDAEPLGLDPAGAQRVGGYDVWIDASGGVVVRDGARAIILSSSVISQRGLLAIVDRSLLILRIGTDDPRR